MKKKILVVEDDFDTRSMIADILKDEDYTVSTADDGLDGLNKLQDATKPYDLIITGIAMPSMKGDEMVSIIRKKDIDIPILVISGGRYERGCELVKEGLVSACLPKPFKCINVLNMVRLLLSDNLGTC